MRNTIFAAAGLVILVASQRVTTAQEEARREPFSLWVHLFFSIATDEGLEQGKDILRRAAAAGYTKALLADYKLTVLYRATDEYRQHLRELQAVADDVGVELVPGVMPIGYSGAILDRNPELDEGLPVRNAAFIVRGREAHLEPDPRPVVRDAGFEEPTGHEFRQWEWQDGAGQRLFADREVFHSGSCSLRMSEVGSGDPVHGHGRIAQVIQVAPFRYYRISVWTRTDHYDTSAQTQIYVADMEGRPRTFTQLQLKPSQDWTQHTVIVNSLEADRLRLYLGVWGGKTGTIWWDDVEMEEVGLVNVLRRPGCPFVVLGDDGTVYEEGTDYEPVPGMAASSSNWWGGAWPEAMPIRIPTGSRIRDGERLRVSFYHAARVLGDQQACCLSEPEVYRILEEQVRLVEEAMHPRTWFFNHDEIRVANWCEACQSRGMTPGELLADNIRRCVEMVRAISPNSAILVWSDMFDPNHNAHGDYYMVNGSWEGSWEGLPSDVVIANWYRDGSVPTMKWFADRGHRQILCGYYDDPRFTIRDWLLEAEANGIPGVVGAMYTTWVPQYGDLEAWARSIAGE